MAKPYPKEFRDDVVAVARKGQAPLSQIGKDFGISEGSLANWMKKADVEDGHRPGLTDSDRAELRDAKKRIRLLEQPDLLLQLAVLGVLSRCRARPYAVLDAGHVHPVGQARLADAEVGSDLLEMDTRLAVPGHAHDVVAELLGVGLGHSAHPSSGTSRHHRSDVTYPCSSPLRDAPTP